MAFISRSTEESFLYLIRTYNVKNICTNSRKIFYIIKSRQYKLCKNIMTYYYLKHTCLSR